MGLIHDQPGDENGTTMLVDLDQYKLLWHGRHYLYYK